jgi:hypothetical protein
MWQGCCQMKCDQQKSRGGVAEGLATKQISSVVLVFQEGRVVFFQKMGLDLYLQLKYKKIRSQCT